MSETAKTENAPDLKTLKPGTPILVEIAGKKVLAKLYAVTPIGRIQCRVSGRITWCDAVQYKGLPEGTVATPLELPGVGVGAVTLAKPEGVPLPPTLSEFGFRVLKQIGKMESDNKAAGAISASVEVSILAIALDENLKRVAASFVALNKHGYLVKSGGHGNRAVELSIAGWEVLNGGSEEQTAPPEVIPEVIPNALPEAQFEITDEMIAAMQSVSLNTASITDIFAANTLRAIAESRPDLVELSASKSENAYFDAKLTAKAVEMLPEVKASPEIEKPIAKEPKSITAIQQKNASEVVVTPEGETRPRYRKHMGGEGRQPTKGGRPSPREKSLRENALEEVTDIIATDSKISYRDIVVIVAERLRMKVHPTQNVLVKLLHAGYLEMDASGRVATPVRLTEKGRAGYSSKHTVRLKPEIQSLLAEGLTDAQISRRLGCNLSYVYDVRTNRAAKSAKVAT